MTDEISLSHIFSSVLVYSSSLLRKSCSTESVQDLEDSGNLTWPGSIAVTTKKSLLSALLFLFQSLGAPRRDIKAIQRSAGSSPLGFVSKRFAFISLRGQCFPQTL